MSQQSIHSVNELRVVFGRSSVVTMEIVAPGIAQPRTMVSSRGVVVIHWEPVAVS